MIYFVDHLDFLAGVTRALNEIAPEGPEGLYLRVDLVDVHDNSVIGRWTDEFGSDNWYFDTDPPKGPSNG